MFVPLHDDNPLEHVDAPYVNWGLITINMLVWLVFQSGLVLGTDDYVVASLGLIPAVVNDIAELPAGYTSVPEDFTYITYAFLHGGILHLGSNMLFLWVLGDNIEDAMGHGRYLTFYLLCAAGAGLAHEVFQPASQAPLIGASGAVAGLIGAYLVLHPRVLMWGLVWNTIPLRIPAALMLGGWFVLQVISIATSASDDIAYLAHIGGFLCGAVLVFVFKRAEVALFDRDMR